MYSKINKDEQMWTDWPANHNKIQGWMEVSVHILEKIQSSVPHR